MNHLRKRNGRRGDQSSREGKSLESTVRIMVSHDSNLKTHEVVPVPPRPKVLRLRESTSWYDSPSRKSTMVIPYISDVGKFTGHGLYTWYCDYRSYVSTVTAMITRKLEIYARRHNPYHVVKSNLNRMVRVSFLYAVSKNEYMWDRILFFSRNLEKYGKLIHKVFLHFASKNDENFRFVYSHVCAQTKWLLFRALRPRDKSCVVCIHDLESNLKFKDAMSRYEAVRRIALAMRATSSLSNRSNNLAQKAWLEISGHTKSRGPRE